MAATDSAREGFRANRERELIEAARTLFDERGLQDAPLEAVARAAGINRALIYRHFSSKDELFVLAVTDYLYELAHRLREAVQEAGEPWAQLERSLEAYTDYCVEYPAFVDCTMSLMRRPAGELYAAVSESVWYRLGRGMSSCLGQLSDVLAAGRRTGVFAIEDPDFSANLLYTQTLGGMHFARIGVGVRQAAPGIPETFGVDPSVVKRACVDSALATVRAESPE